MNHRALIAGLVVSAMLAPVAGHAYDGAKVTNLLDAARMSPGSARDFPIAPASPPVAGVPVAPAAPPPSAAGTSPQERLDSLNKAYDNLIETCEGRFGVLNSRFRKQVIRSETIAVMGGLIGVLGAVATCPHCAALASGLAGLANPLQQTFKDNSDTPQDTKSELLLLSAKVQADYAAYAALEPPQPGAADFEVKLAKRVDALRAVDASCRFYTGKAAAAGEGEPAKEAGK